MIAAIAFQSWLSYYCIVVRWMDLQICVALAPLLEWGQRGQSFSDGVLNA